MKKLGFFVISALATISPLYAQVDLHFNLREAVELPGNAILDFGIKNINGDSLPDYIYRDSDNVYIIDGANREIYGILQAPAGTSLLGSGDANGDGYDDIILCGIYSLNPDTNFMTVIFSPDFAITNTIKLHSILPGRESVASTWAGRFNDRNMVVIGTSVVQNGSHYYQTTGGIFAWEYESGQFTLRMADVRDGAIQQIEAWDYENSTRLVLRTFGSYYEEDWEGYTIADKTWSDLELIDNTYSISSLWHVPQSNDDYAKGKIYKLYVGKPQSTDDDYLYFHSHSDRPVKDSIVCIDNPAGDILWYKSGYYCTFCTYELSLVNFPNNQSKDLWIFRTDWLEQLHIRNPYDGYLEEIGIMTGARGVYREISDLENDGIPEFFYMGVDSLYIFDLASQTLISDDSCLFSPDIIQLSSYPNPFNGRISCRFKISVATNMRLDIYDILGRKIAALADDYFEPGIYNITWNASNCSSGTYFAVIRSGEFLKIIKLMLIK